MRDRMGRAVHNIARLFNNALERTRRGGVPATRAVVRVSPRRSTQCWTDARRGGLDDRDSGILPLSSVTQEES